MKIRNIRLVVNPAVVDRNKHTRPNGAAHRSRSDHGHSCRPGPPRGMCARVSSTPPCRADDTPNTHAFPAPAQLRLSSFSTSAMLTTCPNIIQSDIPKIEENHFAPLWRETGPPRERRLLRHPIYTNIPLDLSEGSVSSGGRLRNR